MPEIARKTRLVSRTPLRRKTPLARSTKRIVSRGTKRPKARVLPDKGPKLWSYKMADSKFSRYIRARDRRCFFCPNPATQNSHYWGRGNWATRYDPENCDGICGGCHMRHEGSKQGLYRSMKIDQLGRARYAALEKRARGQMKRRDSIAACMVFMSTVSPASPVPDGTGAVQ